MLLGNVVFAFLWRCLSVPSKCLLLPVRELTTKFQCLSFHVDVNWEEGFKDHKQRYNLFIYLASQAFIVYCCVPGFCSAWTGGSLSLRNYSLLFSKEFLNCGVPNKEEILLHTVKTGTPSLYSYCTLWKFKMFAEEWMKFLKLFIPHTTREADIVLFRMIIFMIQR